ncbi:hypothetical protein BCR41DRAFT_356719 [Lobosporangium transversale]|uniref:Uncharacterized protein n=1 Tax=Lobosporangium transversale TaxID=64571 RepID=A0A1Y2GHN3_9FUNG|nr:hypothetical protein BCR41DRAFT_357385 [Lobosporangium transversale]XP_021879759.1 hypothetical protein BCR41DRAFT_356719 [Lobosporangium transversale]ORZ11030.1 hypothetical protein BCR41DRAFT_357385 [Lobosporangium transversale]ORZ11662.1 hypothetical protein BCR41DRAFT_356719 [Lobosporangium transversale]|eukprot:XP_021879547.1 hypothetical protein BCR41DRAFT_357385 [Lobosporangium transversale]
MGWVYVLLFILFYFHPPIPLLTFIPHRCMITLSDTALFLVFLWGLKKRTYRALVPIILHHPSSYLIFVRLR